MSIYSLYTKIMNIATFFRQLEKYNFENNHKMQAPSREFQNLYT